MLFDEASNTSIAIQLALAELVEDSILHESDNTKGLEYREEILEVPSRSTRYHIQTEFKFRAPRQIFGVAYAVDGPAKQSEDGGQDSKNHGLSLPRLDLDQVIFCFPQESNARLDCSLERRNPASD